MNKELLRKFLDNTCSRDELEQVINWLGEKAGPQDGKSLLYGFFEQPIGDREECNADFDALLHKIHHQVNLHQTEQLLAESHQNPISYNRRRFIFRFIRNAAAILLLPIIGLSIYLVIRGQSQQIQNVTAYQEVYSSVDAITLITLPDGSEAWLNRGSSLRFPTSFNGEKREVELKGEGYFKVVTNPKVPFSVKAGEIRIVALGTEFNVMAYPGENNVETSLVKGRVELYRAWNDDKDHYLLEMRPSELAVYRRDSNKLGLQRISDDRYYAWKEGKLMFINEPMDVVARKLSRWFNVDIQILDKKLLDLSYTATFVNETFSQALELMAIASPIRYSIKERKETSEGLYTKRTVILRSKKK